MTCTNVDLSSKGFLWHAEKRNFIGISQDIKSNKSNIQCRNMLGCLDQYTCRRLRLWNNRDCEMVLVYKCMQRKETMKHSGPWSSLGTHGSLVVLWWLCISSSKCRNVYFLTLNLTLQIKVNCLQGQSGSLHKTVRILTHWGRDKMEAISQTTSSSAFF